MDDIKVDEAAQTLFEQPTNFNDNPDGKEKEKADGKGGYEPDKPAETEEGKKTEEAAKTRQEKINGVITHEADCYLYLHHLPLLHHGQALIRA